MAISSTALTSAAPEWFADIQGAALHRASSMAPADEQQPFPPEFGARFQVEGGTGEGYIDLIRVSDDIGLAVSNCRLNEDFTGVISTPGVVRCRLALSGRIDWHEPELLSCQSSSPTFSMLLHQPGREYRFRVHRDAPLKAVALFFRPHVFADLVGIAVDELPPPLRDFAHGEPTDHELHVLAFNARAARVVNDLLHIPFLGKLAELHVRARTLDLLAICLQSMGAAASERAPCHLSRNDRIRLHGVLHLVQAHYRALPPLSQIARSASLNEYKLKSGFKHLFGRTIFDLARELRMADASELLRKTDMSIAEISHSVGYEYQSNFTAAFRAHYGCSPRAFRSGR